MTKRVTVVMANHYWAKGNSVYEAVENYFDYTKEVPEGFVVYTFAVADSFLEEAYKRIHVNEIGAVCYPSELKECYRRDEIVLNGVLRKRLIKGFEKLLVAQDELNDCYSEIDDIVTM